MTQRSLKVGLVIAVSLHAFDELVLTIALPTIVRDLGGGDWYGISLASYILAALIGGVWGGVSTDQRGPLRIFLIGYSLFAVGLVVATLANNMSQFILARCLQGLGGGISWTVAFAVTNIAIPTQQRSRMVAWLDSAWLLPSLLAPTIGGYIIDYLDWHWIFLMQLPLLALATLLLVPQFKPLSKKRQLPSKTSSALFAASRMALGAAIVLTLLSLPVDAWWLLMPIGFLIAWRPFFQAMPTGFSHAQAGLAAAVAFHFLLFYCFYAVEMFMPLMLIELRGLSSSLTGLVFTCCAIAWIAASFLQSNVQHKWALHQSLSRGMVLVLLGIAIVSSMVNSDTPLWIICIGWAVTGFGMGFSFNSVVSAAMDFTPAGKEGATSMANGIVASMGIGLAAGIGGAINNHNTFSGGTLEQSLGYIWVIAIAAGIGCLWISHYRLKHYRHTTNEPAV
jgi:MFS family permease